MMYFMSLEYLTTLIVQISNRGSVFSIWGSHSNFRSVIYVIIIYAFEIIGRRRES